MRRLGGLLVSVALLAGACGLPQDLADTVTTETTTPETTTTVAPDTTTTVTTEGSTESSPSEDAVLHPDPPSEELLARMVELAIADLVDRFGVDPTAIEVLEAEPVTWPDGSLGCPQPGMLYTQALVEGYRVVLGYQGHSFFYHAGPDAIPFYCEAPTEAGGGDPAPPPVVMR